MNIFTKITLRSLKRNKLRTLMSIVGVTLSVAMISGVLAFATSFQYFMVQYERQITGDWYACVYSPKGIDLLKAQRDKRTDRIGTYREIGYIRLDGIRDSYKPYIQLVDPDSSLDAMARIKLVDGRMPKNSTEVVLPVTVATQGGRPLKLGEKISGDLGIRISGGEGRTSKGSRLTAGMPYEDGEQLYSLGHREYTLVGISEGSRIISYSTPGYMALTVGDGSSGFSEEKNEDLVAYIKTKKPDAISRYMGEIFPENNVEFNNNLLLYLGATNFGMFSTVLSIISGALILLIMIGSIALIYNSVSITVGERMKEYGLLSSIGATRRQRRMSVITEGLLISTIGIPLGILMGVGGIWIALKVMGRFAAGLAGGVDTQSFGLHLHPPMLILMVILSLVTVLISVTVPANRASKVSIIDAIRRGRYLREGKQIFRVPRFFEKYMSFEQVLSNRYFRKSGRKYRATIISLTLSMTLFLSANFVGSYFLDDVKPGAQLKPKYNVEYMYTVELGAEASIQKGEEIYKKLSAAPGITGSKEVEYAYMNNQVGGQTGGIPVAIMSTEDYDTYLKGIGSIGEKPRAVLLERELSDEKRVSLFTGDRGDPIIIEGNSLLVRTVTVKNTPPGSSYYLFDQIVVMPREVATETFGDYSRVVTEKGMFFKCRDPEKTYRAMEKICREEGFSTQNLRNLTGAARDAKNLLIMINVFAYGFVVLISLIAIVNVFNTMTTNIMVRRREFAVLRAVGMTDKSFRKMMKYESLIYGVRSLLLSLGISLIISIVLYNIFWLGVGFSYIVPWRAIFISIIIVFLAVFATMAYAVGKVNQGNLMEALKKENL